MWQMLSLLLQAACRSIGGTQVIHARGPRCVRLLQHPKRGYHPHCPVLVLL
jgi:hypothetical protein